MPRIFMNAARGMRLAATALGLAALYTAVLVVSGTLPEANAHMTCYRDYNAEYTDGLNHIHGSTKWQINTYKSSYGGPGAYLAWQSFGPSEPWNGITYQGAKFCPGY